MVGDAVNNSRSALRMGAGVGLMTLARSLSDSAGSSGFEARRAAERREALLVLDVLR